MLWWLLPALAADVSVTTVTDAPVVDGVLDEAIWSNAPAITSFVRYQPVPGGPPEGTTEVRVLQDDTHLYVGVRVRGQNSRVRARVSPREDINSDDQVGIYLDPFGDAQAGYIFYFNALGIQQDIQFTSGEWNVSWNAVYRSRGTVTDDGHGYDLEIALPFRSIKYPGDTQAQTWGLMVTRKVPAEGAKYSFPPQVRGHPRLFTQAARLEGVMPPQRGSGIELIPGLTLRAEATRPTVDDRFTWTDLDPWHEPIRPSLDLRFGVGPNLALVGTINPDFSQVESDITPVVLNARFAFRFRERRPFFTEGAGFFEDPQETLYSRSIVQPLYGLKLAGREGRWSMGILHATDRSPSPSFHEEGTPGFDDMDGRWAVNTLARLRHDLPNAGWIGLTVADKRLVQEGFAPTGPALPRWAGHDNVGLDLNVPLPRRWALTAFHDQSYTASWQGQQGGGYSQLRVARPSGTGLGFDLMGSFRSLGYRQELGFLNQTGLFDGATTVDWTVPGKGRLTSYAPVLSGSMFEEVSGDHYRTVQLGQEFLFDGVHLVTIDGGIDARQEGASRARVPGWNVGAAYSGQIGAAAELRPSFRYRREMDFRDLTPTRSLRAQLDATLRIARPVRIDLIARYTRLDRELPSPALTNSTEDVLVRGRVLLQLHRAWGVRLISAYNLVTDRTPSLESSALVTWLIHPFTAIHVGYAELTQLGPNADTLSRSVFLKAHVLLRPDAWRRKGRPAKQRGDRFFLPPLVDDSTDLETYRSDFRSESERRHGSLWSTGRDPWPSRSPTR